MEKRHFMIASYLIFLKETGLKLTKSVGSEAPPRESQSCSMLKNEIYLFGGQGSTTNEGGQTFENFSNDLYKLKIQFEDDKVIATCEELQIQGPIPSKRSSHATCAYKERYMFIIGGEGYPTGFDEENKANEYKRPTIKTEGGGKEYVCCPKNDVWYFDVETALWFEVNMKNRVLIFNQDLPIPAIIIKSIHCSFWRTTRLP